MEFRNTSGAITAVKIMDLYEVELTSVRMHREFGYQEIASAPGFLHVKLESGKGILFAC